MPIEIGSQYTDENWSQDLMTLSSFIDRYISVIRYMVLVRYCGLALILFVCLFVCVCVCVCMRVSLFLHDS